MTKPLRVRLYGDEQTELDYLSITNYELGTCKLVRMGVQILTHLSRMNGGQIPLLSQIKLQKALVRRARADARRK